MSFSRIFFTNIERVWPGIWRSTPNLVKRMAKMPTGRKLLNAIYDRLSPRQLSAWHSYYAKIFRDSTDAVVRGEWRLFFAGRKLRMPLTPERMWLDWDSAISALGHENSIKRTYEAFINAPQKPEIFLDIGANYGVHSLLFALHGIQTISFEPNPACYGYFRDVFALNGLTPRIEELALSDESGSLELSFPERDTWLGSLDPEVTSKLKSTHKLITRKVTLRTLDEYLPELRGRRILIKIDTEGHEESALHGGIRVLNELHPPIIFESFRNEKRGSFFTFLKAAGYEIALLPGDPQKHGPTLDLNGFINCESDNFIAWPAVSGPQNP